MGLQDVIGGGYVPGEGALEKGLSQFGRPF